jgi:6-phosphogluconate dehydrogenase
MQISIYGLGRMGMQIAKRLKANGFDVLAWNGSEDAVKEFSNFGGTAFSSIPELVKNITDSPRIFWVMLPSNIVEDFIFGKEGLGDILQDGDIVIDGGNSLYKESVRRAQKLSERGIKFYDSGTSGGVWGEKNGFAIMVGGDKNTWPQIEPIFKTLSSGANYGLVGPAGAGHFVKMVHNGIEYGMMEAIAEGYAIMEASPFKVDLPQVTKIYQEGSVVRSWLIDLMADIFAKENIQATVGLVDATGEGAWTVEAAKELGVDARVIEDSLKVREESKDPKNQELFRNKILALLRKQFGGHAIKSKE